MQVLKQYKFSVAMCVYYGDNPLYFDEALKSVFNQTLFPDEVVLVVDGPIGVELERVVSKYTRLYTNFHVWRLEKNMGHGIARSECLKHCSYKYVAISDADDINALNRFEKQIQHFKKNDGLSAVSSACYHFKDDLNNILNVEKLPTTDDKIKKYLKKRCPLCQASVMFKKKDVDDAGGYIDWYHAEDYYLWIRMYLNGAVFENDEESLVYVRTTNEQAQRRGGIKYFKSIKKLFKFMFEKRIINFFEYFFSVVIRFIVQVLLPNRIRAFVRKVFQ